MLIIITDSRFNTFNSDSYEQDTNPLLPIFVFGRVCASAQGSGRDVGSRTRIIMIKHK